jgi:Family of unknown function (DUF6370)
MKVAWRTLFGLLAIFAVVIAVQAADKEETLKGTITCAKCDLKLEKKACATVIVVAKDKKNKDGKDIIYYFDTDSHKKNHKPVCMEAKKGTVTGIVSEKDGKKIIKVTKVDFDDKEKDK